MLTSRSPRAERSGIVLVLVLAMLGLLALVGVTFATYAQQSRSSNRQFMLSLFQPQADELIDFGLSQLITDTNDIRSVIRGHSMARDMFGTDATNNALLGFSPTTGLQFSITGVAQPNPTGQPTLFDLTTNISSGDSSFFGYHFLRWAMQVTYAQPGTNTLINGGSGTVTQSFEILGDTGYIPGSTAGRTFRVNINFTDAGGFFSQLLASPLVIPPPDPMLPTNLGTALWNPTLATPNYPNGAITQLPGLYIANSAINTQPLGANTFTLDGRWLHAFNGPGMGQTINTTTGMPASYYGNFRLSGPNATLNSPGLVPPNAALPLGAALSPGAMDEDYDACDLENWFLAIQSADGNVMIPSFHRPSIIRIDPNYNTNDWLRQNQSNNGGSLFADSAARILRPCQADGHDASTFPDLVPDSNTGKIAYDVDNDGDGTPDSVWLDLGYPARKDSSGRLYKPLFAFMVIGLNGRIPLNTAGNLAAQVGGYTPNNPAWMNYGLTPPPSPVYGGQGTAVHLGNSTSELDPTYGLMNAFNPAAPAPGYDGVSAFIPYAPAANAPYATQYGYLYNGTSYPASNTQVDTAGIDVRLTQLRNLLAGTRAADSSFQSNGESNMVVWSTGLTTQQQLEPMPNGIADLADMINTASGQYGTVGVDPGTNLPYVVRSSTPVAGRWGEAQSIPGSLIPNPNAAGAGSGTPSYVNLVGINYANPVRAGYSINIRDILNGLPPDIADDNFNCYDPFPLPNSTDPHAVQQSDGTNTVMIYGGEIGDADYYDAAGALLFPAERMRRWVTPADINGTGSVNTFNLSARTNNRGADGLGRVEFNSYFRPPGSPGVISTNYEVSTGPTGTGAITSVNGTNLGAIYFPSSNSQTNNSQFYGSGPNAAPAGVTPTAGVPYPYLPDMTSNPLHSLEAGRFPNQNYPPAGSSGRFTPQNIGGSPSGVMDPFTGMYLNTDANTIPTSLPTYDYYATAANGPVPFAQGTNATVHSDGLNDADEMNYYYPNPLYDSAFGPGDIEWLYRKQDVDGATLSSRLSQLAPVSFMNGLDGARRRRLYALDSADLNTFSWTNDNPVQPTFVAGPTGITQLLAPAFPNNSRFTANTNAGFQAGAAGTTPGLLMPGVSGLLTPALAQRDKKVNLNYPLPVSNDSNEPVRQKWINDTYQLLKSILPPRAVDTAEELAQLSQFVINIIDFRDTDSTMTHWVNPDVLLAGIPTVTTAGGVPPPATVAMLPVPPTLILNGTQWPPTGFPATAAATTTMQLDQWGMEYNPVAINEVLAFSYLYYTTGTTGAGANTRANRFFIELVNTQTSPEISAATLAGFNPVLDLGGFSYNTPEPTGTLDPYLNGTWDIIFTGDDPYSRPDPYRGQLNPYANLYAVTPLSQTSFSPPTAALTNAVPNNGPTATDGYDVQLIPLNYQGAVVPAGTNAFTGVLTYGTGGVASYTGSSIPVPLAAGTTLQLAPLAGAMTAPVSPLPLNYFYVIGNAAASTANETGTPGPTTSIASNGSSVTVGTSPTQTTMNNTQLAAGVYNVPVSILPTQIQSLKPSMDPTTAVAGGGASPPSPVNLYQGVLPGLWINPTTTGGNINPSTTTPLPPNYLTKLPTIMDTTVGNIAPNGPAYSNVTKTGNGSGYYWVCLRRPANLFAPVSATNPMVVVDSMRFPYLDGTGLLGAPPAGVTTPPSVPSLTAINAPYSVQRYQPFRGGHAVPLAPPMTATLPIAGGGTMAVDSRYGYTEQIVVPGTDSQVLGTRGVFYTPTTGAPFYSTPTIYHTLGWANEYEQGSLNSMSEPWEYFPFNDRDFTSVAELMLVPGCPPGLFTKQFVEFAPSLNTATNVFGVVVPNLVPPTLGPLTAINPAIAAFTMPPTPSYTIPTGGYTLTSVAPVNNLAAFYTASTPFGYFYDTAAAGASSTPIPRSYPYLNDEFFYTGFGGTGSVDPPTTAATMNTALVGGYGADGWFKMFEFFEVPSQAMGAIGPVATGSNFDWYRQDTKFGQLNLNLIMDEEVFFSVAGGQTISQTNGQTLAADGVTPVNATNQFSQTLLNFNQIPVPNVSYYQLAASTPAYPSFMLTAGAAGQYPIPLVVTSTLANGTPRTATPIATTASVSPGMTDTDPLSNYAFGFNNTGTNPTLLGPPWPNGNNLKAAWVQFLNLRHGGSGFLFGYGLGATGQNSTVGPVSVAGAPGTGVPGTPPQGIPANLLNNQWATGIPAERPFHSLSYPDINLTIMRPAVLPPSPYTNPAVNTAATVPNTGPTGPPLIYYAGDPGVRNATLFLGYTTGSYPGTIPPAAAGLTEYTLTTPWGTSYSPALPPAVPLRRLFQVADSYRGGTVSLSATGMGTAPSAGAGAATTFPSTITNGGSNASTAADPFLNNVIPVAPLPADAITNVPYYPTGGLPPIMYAAGGNAYFAALTRNNVDLYWPGANAASVYDGTVGDAAGLPNPNGGATPAVPPLPSGVSNPHLGSSSSGANADMREHPYWRSEQMQRLMNLTTPRTHQYAVWLTIGFFEVKRQGDLGMLAYNPTLAFDIMGPEIGAANGKSTRYRGFYLVNRLNLTGFNPSSPTGFKQALVYKQRIQ